MPTVDVGRLRGIAETVRQLPGFYHYPTVAGHYFRVVCEGAKFIREAETLGVFQGDSVYGRIGKKLRHPSCHLENVVPTPAGDTPVWKLSVWYAVVDTLAPELIEKRSRAIVTDANGQKAMLLDTSPKEAEIVARAIEAEADRIEAELAAKTDRSPRGDHKQIKPTALSYKQPELDAAICEDIAKHEELLQAARARRTRARKEVAKVFGRNETANRLRVAKGSRNMVSRSKPYQDLAEEFRLRRKRGPAKPSKVGLAVAEEEAAESAGDTTRADVIRRETRGMIEDVIAQAPNNDHAALAQLLDRFDRRKVDDDTARKTLALYEEQAADGRARKVLSE